MGCDDCSACSGSSAWVVDPELEARLDGALGRPCRHCSHELGAHRLAAARTALPGLDIRKPSPGSPNDRLLTLRAAFEAGQVTEQEYRGALHRLVVAALDPPGP